MHRTGRMATAAILPALVLISAFGSHGVAAQAATPTMTYSCEAAAMASPMVGTPSGAMDQMTGMATGTPAAETAPTAMELDQLYIDMMIPHHRSIIALAEAALPRLTDARLQTMARSIIEAQGAEITELQGYRQQWYGSAESMPMDAASMAAMMQMMPSMTGTMQDMARQMDPETEVTAFCAGANPNLTFIDLTIPHHQSAIQASETAVTRAKHPEIQAFAQRVIADQQREIDELQQIRAELTGQATPASA